MKRILIDLTDLETWGGHHGGTQRVVYGIAKEFYNQHKTIDEEVVFVSFSSTDEAFHLSDFTPIMQRVTDAGKIVAADTGPVMMGRKARLKQQIRIYVPEKVWKNARLQTAARQTLHHVRRAKHIIDRQIEKRNVDQNIVTRQKITLQTDDVMLILGKPWDNPAIQRYLAAEKQRINFKLAQVVYDLIICLNPHMHHPSLFKSYTRHMFEAISISDLLLPISQSSAKDVRIFAERLHMPVPAMKVIRLGDTLSGIRPVDDRPDARINNKFVLCVGTIEIRKNHMLLYYAYRLAHEQGIQLPQMIIVGARGWLSGDLQYLIEHDPAMQGKILVLDNISDAGLDWLYRHCRYTIYPTMYEGWGLPVAESLGYGKFCLASNSSSVPEIAGDLIEYMSPYNPAECLMLMQKYADDKLLLAKEKAVAHKYRTTDWSATFDQVYRALA